MQKYRETAGKTKKDSEHKNAFARDAWIRYKRNKTAVLGLIIVILIFLMAIFANVISPYGPYDCDYSNILSSPSAEHWFGTDNLGRDLFTRCMYGARVSLAFGFLSMVGALGVGGTLGMIAAYFGRTVDNVIMRIMDVIQAIPGTLMAIVVVACLGNGIPQLFIAMTVSVMPGMSKTIRAAILTVRESEFIEASRCLGASNLRLMLTHMLPNSFGHFIIYAVSSISGGIMCIATLSYISLGISPPTPEWGSILSTGKDYIQSHVGMVLFPGLLIMITVLGFNMIGDGLRDALDPRLK